MDATGARFPISTHCRRTLPLALNDVPVSAASWRGWRRRQARRGASRRRFTMHMQFADYLVHISNIMLLVSYSVRDILWLRWFAVGAALINIPYFLLQGTVLWPPVLWALVFIAINLYQITRIYLERRLVVLSDDERKLYDLGFRSLRPREFVSLSLVGEWKSAEPGETVVTEAEPVAHVCVAIRGGADVYRRGERIG